MLTQPIDEMRKNTAKFLRDVEYIKETALDDMLDERMEVTESIFESEKMEELIEAAEMVKKLSGEEDIVEESAEVERILNAEEDMTFEEMIGIE